MSVVINTNVDALKIQNTLTSATNKLSQTMQRMSSGLKINSAKDDAAGTVISARMSVQLDGNKTCQNNVQNANSMLATAEGNLDIVLENVSRIRDLTLQAKNGTYSTEEIKAMQDEVAQRIAEIDRISASSKFSQLQLFGGTELANGATFQVGTNSSNDNTITVTNDDNIFSSVKFNDLLKGDNLDTAKLHGQQTGFKYDTEVYDTIADIGEGVEKTVYQVGTGDDAKYYRCTGANNFVETDEQGYMLVTNMASTEWTNAKKASDYTFSQVGSGDDYTIQANDIVKFKDGVYAKITALATAEAATAGTKEAAYVEPVEIANEDPTSDTAGITGAAAGVIYHNTFDGKYYKANSTTQGDVVEVADKYGTARYAGDSLPAHVAGTNDYIYNTTTNKYMEWDSDNNKYVDATNAQIYSDSNKFDLTKMVAGDGSVKGSFGQAIDALDVAIDDLTARKSSIGSFENRLESALNTLTTQYTNLSSAKSIITDADIASEASIFTQNQILQQVSTSLLAQANQAPSIALSLL